MDYRLFKLMCEMAHIDTFGKDKKIRQLYKNSDDKVRRELIQDLYGSVDDEVKRIFDNKLI